MGAGVCLEILAWTAGTAGDHEHAARLLGACQGIKRGGGAAVGDLSPYAEHHARCARDARAALGDTTYSAAFDQGSQFTLDEAVGHVLGARRGTPVLPSPHPTGPPHAPLTRREQQVAQLVAEGLSNSDIAARLIISPRTAESHVAHSLTKLGFTARAQLAAWIANQTGPSAAS